MLLLLSHTHFAKVFGAHLLVLVIITPLVGLELVDPAIALLAEGAEEGFGGRAGGFGLFGGRRGLGKGLRGASEGRGKG